MASEYDLDKVVSLNWVVHLKLPNGEETKSDNLASFEDAIKIAAGMQDALNLEHGLKIGWRFLGYGVGRQYTDGKDGFEYIRVYCAQGDKLMLKDDSQLRIGTYVDYVCAGYQWLFETPSKHGVRVVGQETIYRDWWITGSSFYMTNDSKLDSVDLGPEPRHALVEFVPLGEKVSV